MRFRSVSLILRPARVLFIRSSHHRVLFPAFYAASGATRRVMEAAFFNHSITACVAYYGARTVFRACRVKAAACLDDYVTMIAPSVYRKRASSRNNAVVVVDSNLLAFFSSRPGASLSLMHARRSVNQFNEPSPSPF